jgi:hypothetical protein
VPPGKKQEKLKLGASSPGTKQFRRKQYGTDGPTNRLTNRPTDGPTDGRTDEVSYRGAMLAPKNNTNREYSRPR